MKAIFSPSGDHPGDSPPESVRRRGRFRTVTWNVCVADSPPGSVAVTVTLEVPSASAVTVTLLTDTDTVATPVSDETAE